ncbi:hypothetical protein H3146_20595 [Streptomyces sp. OF3]|uniref:Uncharacterized protein n=1 Tax=Streptomyces alkaliterrae TaxID=2213162 RepID=A0A7W3WNT0_9ACTN|nr:hypothetical protein [Streptomyces alkaliterrae]MBB1255738.1 hypothetical protein [Streptomyces alkaliterrae]
MLITRVDGGGERDVRRVVDHVKLCLVPTLAAHGMAWCDAPPPVVPSPGFRAGTELGTDELRVLLHALRRWSAR